MHELARDWIARVVLWITVIAHVSWKDSVGTHAQCQIQRTGDLRHEPCNDDVVSCQDWDCGSQRDDHIVTRYNGTRIATATHQWHRFHQKVLAHHLRLKADAWWADIGTIAFVAGPIAGGFCINDSTALWAWRQFDILKPVSTWYLRFLIENSYRDRPANAS